MDKFLDVLIGFCIIGVIFTIVKAIYNSIPNTDPKVLYLFRFHNSKLDQDEMILDASYNKYRESIKFVSIVNNAFAPNIHRGPSKLILRYAHPLSGFNNMFFGHRNEVFNRAECIIDNDKCYIGKNWDIDVYDIHPLSSGHNECLLMCGNAVRDINWKIVAGKNTSKKFYDYIKRARVRCDTIGLKTEWKTMGLSDTSSSTFIMYNYDKDNEQHYCAIFSKPMFV